jgi:hypothetical protein
MTVICLLMDAAASHDAIAAVGKQKNPSESKVEMTHNGDVLDDMITLNVSGALFRAPKSTLLKAEGSYFHAMLGSGYWLPNEMGTRT